MIIPYSQCQHILQEADVLLFRHANFPCIGWWIGAYSQSPYSHVGLAHFDREWYCLEFREFKGARKYPLDEYVKENPGKIDVFRVYKSAYIPSVVKCGGQHYNCYQPIEFTEDIAKKITGNALDLIKNNSGYGYHLIFKILKTYIPFVRLWRKPTYTDTNGNIYVCSTLITKTYRKHYVDPVDFLADEYTKPGDIARSVIFHNLFTIA